MFFKKDVLKSFEISVFHVTFAEFLRTPFLQSFQGRLLLNGQKGSPEACNVITVQKMKFSIKYFFSKYD